MGNIAICDINCNNLLLHSKKADKDNDQDNHDHNEDEKSSLGIDASTNQTDNEADEE